MDYRIKVASINDMQWILSMSANEGWNPGLRDATIYQQTDPTGFFVGTLNGKIISCISAVKYQTFAHIGLFIVDKKYRKKGYGYKIWQHAMNSVKGFMLGIVAVPEQIENYTKSGFKIAHSFTRYGGVISDVKALNCEKIIDAKNVPIDQLFRYDRLHFPDDRKQYIMSLLITGSEKGLVYVDNETIQGFGVIRQCVCGYRIGPLFAESMNIAESLIHALYRPLVHSQVFINCPGSNVNAAELAIKLELKPSVEDLTMFTGDIAHVHFWNVYGLATSELG